LESQYQRADRNEFKLDEKLKIVQEEYQRSQKQLKEL
jgi:hypothetical protein